MKTGLVTALLLLGMIAPLTTALADPVEDATDLALAVAGCAVSAVHPDGEVTVVQGHPQQTYVDTDPACLD